MFRLKVARSAAEIDELRAPWESLEASSHNVFQSYLWNRRAAEVFTAREQPHFIFAESDSGMALIPAVICTEPRCISLAGEKLFDYRDYLARGDERPLLRACEVLAALNLPVSVTAVVAPDNAIWHRLPKSYFCSAPQLLHDEGYSGQDFAEEHSRAFSRLRKLERMGLRICEYSGASPVVQQIYAGRARRPAAGELFQDRLRTDFMVAICRAMANRCEVFTLEHGSTLAAALVTFRDGNFRRFYTTCYDHNWARYSPGVCLLFEVGRRSLDQGLSVDLMTGEQPYKQRIARETRSLFQVNATAEDLRQAFPISTQEAA
ncbi:MAG: GNAT family N-acetyltransferase [Acidobacteria bacterium]|nr:GNAT family N-acetyltransferase [Acidobacteriota bacterium]MBV9146413.1 GNAT family N-acetyltransferase [Acidobacteriota bacterium]